MEGFLLNEQTWLQHLKEKRLAYGLSQNRLAVATGITRQYLSDIETGKVKPSEDLQQSLWEALERFNPDAPLEMLFDYVRIRFPTTDVQQVNPAAVTSYEKRGGDKLIGRSLLDCHNPESRDKIQQVVEWFAANESHNIVYTFHNEKQNKDVYMVALRDEGKLIGYYEKHEYRNVETMKQYDLW